MSDISFGTLTFNGSFTAPTSGTGNYSLMWVSCPAGESEREMVDHKFFGLDGIESVDGGANPQEFTLTGLIAATDAAGIANAEAAIRAEQDGTAKTMTRWTVPVDGVELKRFKPGPFKRGEFCYESFQIIFREL